MQKKSSLTLIIPCYNESESIPSFVLELKAFLAQLEITWPDVALSVLVVDNKSSDSSYTQLLEAQRLIPELTLELCSRQGYGAALKYGFAKADSDYFAFLDLDNTYPLESLIPMWKKMQQDQLDIVYGARIHADSNIPKIRSLGNRFYVFLLKLLLNSQLTDVCSGMRIFKREKKHEVLNLTADDLSFSIEFTAAAVAGGWRIGECPIPYRERTGESKLSVVRDGFKFLAVVLTRWSR